MSESVIGRNWVEDHSPVLANLKKEIKKRQPFKDLKVGVCLPGTWESYMFLSTLASGGADIWFHPMFCQPEVGIEVLRDSIRIVKNRDIEGQVYSSDLLYDSTAYLGKTVVDKDTSIKGIVEQTASGITIYSEYSRKGLLKQPVMNLDSSFVKKVGENQLATGLGLLEALFKLHLFIPSKHVLVLGFGNVGRGCASFLRKLGCEVGVYDIDDGKMREAESLRYERAELEEALSMADIVVNATGSFDPVLDGNKIAMMKSGAVLANMGGAGWDRSFFSDKFKEKAGRSILKIYLDDSKYIYEIAQGLPVNFILASGTDTETMDLVFSLSILTLEYLIRNFGSLPKTLQPIPEEIQQRHFELVSKFSTRKDLIKLMERQ